jgi:hypothetical protein
MATFNASELSADDSESDTMEISGQTASNTSVSTPVKKKPKRLCQYRAEWSAEFTWIAKVPGNVFSADCNLCRKAVSIAHGGRSDLLQHSKTDGHKKAVRAATTTNIKSFFTNTSQPTGIDRQVGLCHIVRLGL